MPKANRHYTSKGYVVVIRQGHPLADSKGRVREHRLVWYEAHGSIPEGHHIHHRNGKKDDNRLENLECLPLREHRRLHWPEVEPSFKPYQKVCVQTLARWKKKHGAWNKGKAAMITLSCSGCGRTFERRRRYWKQIVGKSGRQFCTYRCFNLARKEE